MNKWCEIEPVPGITSLVIPGERLFLYFIYLFIAYYLTLLLLARFLQLSSVIAWFFSLLLYWAHLSCIGYCLHVLLCCCLQPDAFCSNSFIARYNQTFYTGHTAVSSLFTLLNKSFVTSILWPIFCIPCDIFMCLVYYTVFWNEGSGRTRVRPPKQAPEGWH